MKKGFYLVIFLTCIFTISIYSYGAEEDANWQMWHGNQDALILGTIAEIGTDSIRVNVEKKLYPKGIINDVYRQIPSEDIGNILEIEKFAGYETSYNDKKVPGVGDIIIVSLDEGSEIWQVNWLPFEVSDIDYRKLEFLPSNRETPESFAWTTFIQTDGKMNDFTFKTEKNIKKVIGKGIYTDGKIIEDEIYTVTDTVPFTINISFIRKNMSKFAVGGMLILIGGLSYYFYKKKKSEKKGVITIIDIKRK